MVGLLAGVLEARRTGRGRDVDTNLHDVALSMLTHHAAWFLTSGIETPRRPMSGHASVVPFQFFATADGYIAIACAKEHFFRKLLIAIDRTDLAEDERFADMQGRDRHRDALLPELADAIEQQTTDAWMARLKGSVPAAPVTSMEDALDISALQDRHMLAEYEHPVLGRVRSVGTPVTVSGFEPSYRHGPALGQDGPSLLESLGYDSSSQDLLRERGAFGAPADIVRG